MNLRAICLCIGAHGACALGLAGAPDVTFTEGRNFALAAFRFWAPPGAAPVRAVTVLVPGSNSDGRGQVDDAFWRAFAERRGLALVGCCFRDRPHDNMNIEEYARAGDGSGAALLDALRRFGESSAHPEAAEAPLLLWGMSAGGEFNYEFTCWRPERVAAFVVNKGGYYFTHLAPPAARKVPGIFFIGSDDADFRKESITGIVAVNREAGARWTLVVEPHVGHALGDSPARAVGFFEECLSGGPVK
jgi:poly(3-hydroxybutyrate) depolymerase